MVTKSRLDEYDSLSTAEKILRLHDLWDEISAVPEDVPLTAAQQSELDRRLKDFRRDPNQGSPWAEARKRIRSRKQ